MSIPNKYTITTVKSDSIHKGSPPGNIIVDSPKEKARENLFRGKVEESGPLTYKLEKDGPEYEFTEIGQEVSKPVNELEQTRDDNGFTNPNLHRRIDPKMPEDPKEVVPREYRLQIQVKNSYRNTHVVTHLDYTDLEKYEDSENYDEIADRLADCEAREIP